METGLDWLGIEDSNSRNPHANHAFEVSREFLAIWRKSAIRDFSRTSCT
jgi:hypothetical protein